jgi:hypothetical protein
VYAKTEALGDDTGQGGAVEAGLGRPGRFEHVQDRL